MITENHLIDLSFLPEFLLDIPKFVSLLFGITVQTAIVNIYSPGDKLALYRDTSRSSPAVLGSVLLHSKALLIAGVGDEESVVVWIRSGGIVVMSGEAGRAFVACLQNLS